MHVDKPRREKQLAVLTLAAEPRLPEGQGDAGIWKLKDGWGEGFHPKPGTPKEACLLLLMTA